MGGFGWGVFEKIEQPRRRRFLLCLPIGFRYSDFVLLDQPTLGYAPKGRDASVHSVAAGGLGRANGPLRFLPFASGP